LIIFLKIVKFYQFFRKILVQINFDSGAIRVQNNYFLDPYLDRDPAKSSGSDRMRISAAAAGAAAAGAAATGAEAAGAAAAGVAAAAAVLGDTVWRLGGRPLVLGGWGLQLPGI
jgi:hypothetical protein